ncbi:MAG TPA: hypothetical protein EYQ14_18745 [Gammaproteobacteria bacterium]|nr:hypothetical protein [Gammaproteobacteria bacterium]HIL98522.1 hypothetical protein [Pseudomonadales bacterium]
MFAVVVFDALTAGVRRRR